MNQEQTRPVVFFDLETTGVDVNKDKIVEMYFIKVSPDFQTAIGEYYSKVNPGGPIPPEVTEIHGISDADVQDSPKFQDIALELMEFIKGCDLAGYNSNRFDVPLLSAEFNRAGLTLDYQSIKLIDVCNIFRRKNPHTLSEAVKFYLSEEHEDAHSAKADVLATARIFEEQMNRYEFKDIQEASFYSNYDKEIIDLSGNFTYNDKGEIIFNFGKHKNIKAANEPDYLFWMINKGNFSKDTTDVCRSILKNIQ